MEKKEKNSELSEEDEHQKKEHQHQKEEYEYKEHKEHSQKKPCDSHTAHSEKYESRHAEKHEDSESHKHKEHKELCSKEEKKDDLSFDISRILWKKAKKKSSGKDEKRESREKHHDREKHHEKHKNEESKEKNKKAEDVSLSFDYKKILPFVVKNKAFFLVLIPIILMIFFRTYPFYLPRAGDCQSFADNIFIGLDPTRNRQECWAVNSVFSQVQNAIAQQVSSQFPNLPDAQKQALIKQRFNKLLQNKQQVEYLENQIDITAAHFKSQFQDDNGYTYLPDIDSYVWLQQATNLLKTGYVGDKLFTGKVGNKEYVNVKWNSLKNAPFGGNENPNLHSYAIVGVYKIGKIFSSKFTPMRASFYIPIIFSIIGIIAAFFITRKATNDFGGFIAALIVAIHPFFLSRSFGSDTDVHTVVFPLLITWVFVEMITAKNSKKSLILGGVAGFFLGLFSFAWTGWWYIFDFMIATVIIYIAYLLLVRHSGRRYVKEGFVNFEDVKELVYSTIVMIASTGIFVSWFRGYNSFITSPLAPFKFITGQTAAVFSGDNIWPNVYTTVAELNPASISSIINNLGGKGYFYLSIAGILMILALGILRTIQNKKNNAKLNIKLGVLTALWFGATVYSSLSGVRFILLMVAPYAIGLGICFGLVYKYGSRFLVQSTKVDAKIVRTVIILFLVSLLILPSKGIVRAADQTSRGEFPIINDAWYNALTKIKKESNPNAIVNSWWDFGHHFKYLTQRRVTFDGASQNSPQAHWIGLALLTDNEKLAVGILRMLDCGANLAFEELNSELNDSVYTVNLLYKLVVKNVSDADKQLQELGIGEEKRNKVLEYSHCKGKELPENYFITSEDMIGKSGVWGHFGSWDFLKSNLWINGRKWSKEETVKYILSRKFGNYTKEKAEKLYFELQALNSPNDANNWIAPWPSYDTRVGAIGCSINGEEIKCTRSGNTVAKINLTTMDAAIATPRGFLHPSNFVYVDEEDVVVKRYANETAGVGITLIPQNPEKTLYNIYLAAPQTSASLFNRLFFLRGHGLRYFEPFTEQTSVTGNVIRVWKVDWEGKDKLQYYQTKPKAKIEIE